MADVTITPKVNGPYVVQGPIQLVDADGRKWKLDNEVIALCRCGRSSNKPFCDGTHKKEGFQADTHAPAEA
jgi:CDGSH-type Zn-finger protein